MEEHKTFREIRQEYIRGEVVLDCYEKLGILGFVVVLAGFAGWLVEVLLAWSETGQFHMRGGNFLPWINLYAIGAVMLIPITRGLRQNPLKLFLISAAVTGVLELAAGWLVYNFMDKARFWEYDHGWLAFGNIGGFVSPLSAASFGVMAMVLVYVAMPLAIWLTKKTPKRAFATAMMVLLALVMMDEMGGIAMKSLGRPSAMDFYRSRGLEY